MNDSKAPKKYTPSDYAINDRLYRAYRLCDLNEGMAELEANAISFPDYSCNWGRFSKAQDILNREKGLPTDGCFSFSVEVAQFEKMATPCHDPLPNNFSHTEVRQLKDDEPLSFDGCRLFTGVLSSDCKNESEKGIEVVNTGLDRKNIYLIY
jgi:hypothetical protein